MRSSTRKLVSPHGKAGRKMRAAKILLVTLLISCFLPVVAAAAQGEKQNDAPASSLALEVTCFRGTRPTFQSVPNNVWYGRFRQLEDWKPEAGSLPVQAVQIASSMEGPALRVVVSIHLGKKMFEKQERLGSYLLHENERLTLYEMTAFGLEPYELMAARVEKRSAYTPAVTSYAPSVEAREVRALDATFPVFNLKLRNASSKNISALSIEIRVNGRPRISAMAHNRDAVPLIEAGGTYEYKRQFATSATEAGGGYLPETVPDQTLVIKAAVFDDGTFEGDAGFAARYRAFALGFRTQLARLLTQYQQSLQAAEPEPGAALDNLRRRVNALGTELDPGELDKLLADFPEGALDRTLLKEAAEVIMFEMKKEALKAIEEFKQKQDSAGDREALSRWLTSSLDKYREWHERVRRLNRQGPSALP